MFAHVVATFCHVSQHSKIWRPKLDTMTVIILRCVTLLIVHIILNIPIVLYIINLTPYSYIHTYNNINSYLHKEIIFNYEKQFLGGVLYTSRSACAVIRMRYITGFGKSPK